MERLTERTGEGILVKECHGDLTLRTLYQCHGSGLMSCDHDVGYDAINKLAEYEDMEEQGSLLKLPARIGDEIFFISMNCPKDYKKEYCRDHEGSCENCHHRVPEIVSRDFRMLDIPNMDKIFATRESAEAALKEMSE